MRTATPAFRAVFLHLQREQLKRLDRKMARLLHGDGRHQERISIRRDDGRIITISWAQRLVVLSHESEADGWLRRQLASLAPR